MDNVICEATYGEKVFVPPKYLLATEQHGPWWWRQTAWFIECDVGSRLGPYYEKSDAEDMMRLIHMDIKG